ncbi:MAG: hypothetical protein WC960_04555 [Bacteroidales bacterium]
MTKNLFFLLLSLLVTTYGKGAVSPKETVVVIPSATLTEMLLADAVKKGWRFTPYRFCDLQEYKRLAKEENYYFLMIAKGNSSGGLESSFEYLTLLKGGDKLAKGLSSESAIITYPLQPFNDPSGLYHHLIPFYLEAIQNYLAQERVEIPLPIDAQMRFFNRMDRGSGKKLLFAMEYLNYKISLQDFTAQFRNKVTVISPQEVEEALTNSKEEWLIPILIAPQPYKSGNTYYKMVLNSKNYDLLYFRRGRVKKGEPPGFSKEDIRAISTPFSFD